MVQSVPVGHIELPTASDYGRTFHNSVSLGMALPQTKHTLLFFAPGQSWLLQSLCSLILVHISVTALNHVITISLLSGLPPTLDCTFLQGRISVLLLTQKTP